MHDSARASVAITKTFAKSIPKLLRESEHGKLLIENGFKDDLDYCAKLNSSNIIPYFFNGSIKKLEESAPDTLN